MNTFNCKCHFCNKPLVRKRQGVPVKFHFCDIHCKGEYQRTLKPVSREWLVEHYLGKRMDTTQIAHIVKRDPKSVWNWLKDFGIPTRPRGGASNPSGSFKRGECAGPLNAFAGHSHTKETKDKIRAIAKASGRVPYDPLIGSYMKGRKGADHPQWKGGITAERQAAYSSLEWSNAVRSVWKRDNATCQKCGLRQNEHRKASFDIHHIIGFQNKELRTNPDNLVLLCETCHYWVHSKSNKKKEFIKP